MKKRIKKILSSKFIRNVVIMASGTAGAQLIAMILSPIITRLYGPEAFGVMGTFSSLINIIVPVAALTYPIAIVLPRSDLEARGLMKLSIVISGMLSILFLILLFIFNEKIDSLPNLDDVSPFMYLIPLVIIFSGLMQVSEQWLIRTKQFSTNAKVIFWQSVIINGSKVGVGLLYPIAPVLVFFTAISNGLRTAMMVFFSRKSSKKIFTKEVGNKSLKELAKQYYDFPKYRAPEVFLNGVSNGLPVLMLTSFFGVASAGFYTICQTVLSIPSRLIGKSVGDVFYPRIAEAAKNGENVTDLVKKATLVLAGVGILPFGIIILFGPILFSFVFGSNWETAGEYARWIAVWSLFAFMNRPSVQALPVLKAQRFHLVYTIIMLATRLGALAIGYLYFSSDITAIALYGISGAILNFGLITITLKISKKPNAG